MRTGWPEDDAEGDCEEGKGLISIPKAVATASKTRGSEVPFSLETTP